MVTPFGQFLRTKRLERKTSLRQMALDLGVSSAHLSSLETGKKNIPDKAVIDIANYFELDDTNKQYLRQLADQSQPVFKIDMRSASDQSREFLLKVARNLDRLNNSDFEKLNNAFEVD